MAYTVVPTVNTGDAWTAAMHNTYIKDNMSAGVPDIFTTAGDIAYATGPDAATRLGIGSLGSVQVADTSAPRWSSTGVTAATGQANNVSLTNTLTASANGDDLAQLRISGVFAKSTYTGLEAFGALIDGGGWTASGAGTAASAYGVYISVPTIATTNWALYVASGSSVIAGGVDVTTSGTAFIGDNANSFMTTGMTINQGANGNEAFAIKKTSVAHGMTSLAETDTYLTGSVYSSTDGGAMIRGYNANSAGASVGVVIDANIASVTATKSTAATAAVIISAAMKSGTSITTPTADTNLVAVKSGGIAGTTQFILDADGDSHQNVGTAWTNFHGHDDIELITALAANVSRTNDPIREEFAKFLFEKREDLERMKLVTFNDDGQHFINWSRTNMLVIGAIQQLYTQLSGVRQELADTRALIAGA